MNPLYDYDPCLQWEPAPEEYVPREYNTVFPPITKLSDGRLVVDQSRRADGGYEVKIFSNSDHELIAHLPDDCPRAVRFLYTRDWQMKLIRSTDLMGVLPDLNKAERAWVAFLAA